MDKYLNLSQAARLCPNRPHANSIWRWCRRGIKSRSGQRIYLNYYRLGSRFYTTAQDLDHFFLTTAESDRHHFDSMPQMVSLTNKDRVRDSRHIRSKKGKRT